MIARPGLHDHRGCKRTLVKIRREVRWQDFLKEKSNVFPKYVPVDFGTFTGTGTFTDPVSVPIPVPVIAGTGISTDTKIPVKNLAIQNTDTEIPVSQ